MKIRDQDDAPIQSIRFLATVPGMAQPFLTEFALGEGPCGRFVDGLWVEFNKSFLLISQGSIGDDDLYEVKEFIYKMDDVHGRITVTK